METEVQDQERVLQQEAAQAGEGGKPFANAQQEGFEIARLIVQWGSTVGGLLSLPLLDKGPIEQGEEGAVGLDEGIMVE